MGDLSRIRRRGRLGLANSGFCTLRAALECVSSNCSDTSLQCFSGHWITSFQLFLNAKLRRVRCGSLARCTRKMMVACVDQTTKSFLRIRRIFRCQLPLRQSSGRELGRSTRVKVSPSNRQLRAISTMEQRARHQEAAGFHWPRRRRLRAR